MIDDPELVIQAAVLKAVTAAIEPYARQIEEMKRDAERLARYAEEDRKRLAVSLKDDNERNAEEVAEKVVNRIMRSFNLDPDKPADFVVLMKFVKDFQDTMRDARKHGFLVVVGLVVAGLSALAWTAFKTGIKS